MYSSSITESDIPKLGVASNTGSDGEPKNVMVKSFLDHPISLLLNLTFIAAEHFIKILFKRYYYYLNNINIPADFMQQAAIHG